MQDEVYLCGKFNNTTIKKIFEWREKAKKELMFKCNDPAMLLEYTSKNEIFREKNFSSISKEAFNGDLYLLDRSSIILCNLDTGKDTIGTWWEIGYGFAKNKLIVLAGNPKNWYYLHPFIKESCVTFDNLDKAIDYLNSLYISSSRNE